MFRSVHIRRYLDLMQRYGFGAAQVLDGTGLDAKAEIISESFAPYVEGSYEFTDRFQVTLGGRYTWEDKKLEQNRSF